LPKLILIGDVGMLILKLGAGAGAVWSWTGTGVGVGAGTGVGDGEGITTIKYIPNSITEFVPVAGDEVVSVHPMARIFVSSVNGEVLPVYP
jgi:hypothetical protein